MALLKQPEQSTVTPFRRRGATVDNDWMVVDQGEHDNPVQRPVRHQMMAAATAARGRGRARRSSTIVAPSAEDLDVHGRGRFREGSGLGTPVVEGVEEAGEEAA